MQTKYEIDYYLTALSNISKRLGEPLHFIDLVAFWESEQ